MAAEEARACVLERRILLIQACQEFLEQPQKKYVEIEYVQYFIQKFFHFSHSPRLKIFRGEMRRGIAKRNGEGKT